MSEHSVAEAGTRLPELIDRAIGGEPVVITRNGRPVAELRPLPSSEAWPGREAFLEGLDRLAAQRTGPVGSMDAAAFVSMLRDEGEK